MTTCRLYSIVCLCSLILLFSNAIVFYSSLLSDDITSIFIEQNDMTDSESDNESEVPTQVEEEEELHRDHFISEHAFESRINKITVEYLSFRWDKIILPIFTPPPKICV